jgi:hypothetical protein
MYYDLWHAKCNISQHYHSFFSVHIAQTFPSLLIPSVNKVFGFDWNHVCTTSLTSSLAYLHLCNAFLVVQTWKSDAPGSGLYKGCGRSSNLNCLIASTVAAAECECTLPWNKRTPWTANLYACCKLLVSYVLTHSDQNNRSQLIVLW